MKHIQNLLDGVASMFSAFEPRQYRIPTRGEFARDRARLRGDNDRVLAGLRRQIDKQKSTAHGR